MGASDDEIRRDSFREGKKKASSIHKSSRKRDAQTRGEGQRVCSKGMNESLRVELNFSIGGDFLAPINNKKIQRYASKSSAQ